MKKTFVFGSNLKGIHGAGAALYAKENHGAVQGQGEGPQGSSYAIPTKETPQKALKVNDIKKHVDTFLEYARQSPDQEFQLTPIGCGLAGFRPCDIAWMFEEAPENVKLPQVFVEEINRSKHYSA